MASKFKIVPLEIETMDKCSRRMYNFMLSKFHDDLMNDPKYSKEKLNAIVDLEKDRKLFGSNYFESIAQVANVDVITEEYLESYIIKSFTINTNVLGNKDCMIRVIRVDNYDILGILGFYLYLAGLDDKLPMRIYDESKIIMIGKENTCLSVDAKVIGTKYEECIYEAPALTLDKHLSLIYRYPGEDRGSCLSIRKSFVVVMAEHFDDGIEYMIIPLYLWDKYKDTAFIRVINKAEMWRI